MKRSTFTLIIGAVVIIIFGFLLFTFQVRKSEVVVVTTFGKPTRQCTEPGLYARWPWGIQMLHRFDQRVQNFETKFTQGFTHDGFSLLTTVYIGWKITDPMTFYPKFAGTQEPIAEAEKGLERLVGNANSAVLGKHPLSDFVSATPGANKFVDIENEMLASLQTQARSIGYGLDIEFLGIKKMGLPEKVTESVFAQMTSERKVLADKLQFDGESDAQNIRSDAERRAAELLAAADGEATRIRGEGEASAAKSLAVFQQNPELANFIFRLYALEAGTKERTTLILDPHTPPYDLFWGVSTNLLHK